MMTRVVNGLLLLLSPAATSFPLKLVSSSVRASVGAKRGLSMKSGTGTISAFELLKLKAEGAHIISLPYGRNEMEFVDIDDEENILPWGGIERFHNRVLSRLRKRSPETTVAAFYRELLSAEPSAYDPVKRPKEIDLGAIIKDTCDIALVIPFERIGQLGRRFPSLKIRHIESTSNFWSCSYRGDYGEKNICQTRYKVVCDTTRDLELWSDDSVPLTWDQPDSPPTVDVIVNTPTHSHVDKICRQLTTRLWKDRKLDSLCFDFVEPGVRLQSAKLQTPWIVVVAPEDTCSAFVKCLKSVELPAESSLAGRQPGPRSDIVLAKAKKILETVGASVPGWLDGVDEHPTQYYSLVRYSAEELEEDVAANGGIPVALSCNAAWVLELLKEENQESISTGKVALINAGSTKVAALRLPEGLDHMSFGLSRKEDFDELYAEVGDASTVVFYCNFGGFKSLSRATRYLDWLLASGHANALTQRVRVIEGGMGQLVEKVYRDGGMRAIDQYFSWCDSGTEKLSRIVRDKSE